MNIWKYFNLILFIITDGGKFDISIEIGLFLFHKSSRCLMLCTSLFHQIHISQCWSSGWYSSILHYYHSFTIFNIVQWPNLITILTWIQYLLSARTINLSKYFNYHLEVIWQLPGTGNLVCFYSFGQENCLYLSVRNH